jgi:multidrug efflux pump subunit AcrB
MKGITAFALNNSRTVVMVILLVIVGGIYSFKTLPKLEDPFITIREAVVTAQYPGMPVEQVERLITRPIEEEIRSMGERTINYAAFRSQKKLQFRQTWKLPYSR